MVEATLADSSDGSQLNFDCRGLMKGSDCIGSKMKVLLTITTRRLTDLGGGGGNVMMWAVISYTGKATLIYIQGTLSAQRYIDETIQPLVVPII